jgi:hypothetical protein
MVGMRSCASGAARRIKVEKAKHPRTVRGKWQSRGTTPDRAGSHPGRSASRHQKSLETVT